VALRTTADVSLLSAGVVLYQYKVAENPTIIGYIQRYQRPLIFWKGSSDHKVDNLHDNMTNPFQQSSRFLNLFLINFKLFHL
jgi:hypothetical protein